MNIEIKNVKYSSWNSDETHCFKATLYIDGQRRFNVSNRGQGGPNEYNTLENVKISEREKITMVTSSLLYGYIKKINAELSKETVQCEDFTLKNSLELVVGKLMNEWLKLREVKKILKKITYIGQNGNVYTLPNAKIKPTKDNLKKIQQASWWKNSYVILNDLPIEKVMAYM